MRNFESLRPKSSSRRPPRPGVIEATEEDLYFAYRLLLGREPDESGWEHHCRVMAEQHPTVYELARYFLDSDEFARRTPASRLEREYVEVPLKDFSLFISADDKDIGKHIQTTGEYEPHVTGALRDLLQHGYTFVDVGANIGFFTNLAAHLVGASGFVVAVEPMDKNVQLIYRALEKNRFANVRVHVCAVSDRMGLATLTSHAGTSNGQILAASAFARQACYAQTRTLDELTADLSRVDVVKIDIEGYELIAWRGFRRTLEKHRPAVLTEFHPYCMTTFVGVDPLDYLQELFAYTDNISVLQRDGRRTACRGAADVMRQWELADAAARGDGTDHLDLLVQPRH
jgi:FkbM family methyltransferase